LGWERGGFSNCAVSLAVLTDEVSWGKAVANTPIENNDINIKNRIWSPLKWIQLAREW
jgi:hypothetical protein